MFNRFVSVFSLVVILASLAAFASASWQVADGSMSEGYGIIMAFSCLLATIVFTYRFFDPADLDAISIVKGA